jgi:hypothetical protein
MDIYNFTHLPLIKVIILILFTNWNELFYAEYILNNRIFNKTLNIIII